MHNIDSFLARYKKLTDAELLTITNNAENYQPLALEAANMELANRQLKPDYTEELLAGIQVAQQEQAGRRQNIERQVASVLNFINPLSAQKPLAFKLINFLTVMAAALYIVALMFGGRLILNTLFIPSLYSFSLFPLLLSYIVYPVGILLFMLKRKAGWFILAAISMYKALVLTMMQINNIQYAMDDSYNIKVTGLKLIVYGIIMLFTGMLAIAICYSEIRKVYNVSDRAKVLTIGFAATWLLFDIFKTYHF